jgi:hypothetical protein
MRNRAAAPACADGGAAACGLRWAARMAFSGQSLLRRFLGSRSPFEQVVPRGVYHTPLVRFLSLNAKNYAVRLEKGGSSRRF